MNLQCPNCQKTLTVAEQYAGQLMKCPLCSQTFTVPNLAAAPQPFPSAPPPPPPRQETARPMSPPPPPGSAAPSAPASVAAPLLTPPAPPAAAPQGYTRAMGWSLNPSVLRWIPPVFLVLVFLLTFFSWVGAYPGGYGIYTQNAWQAIGKGYSVDPVGEGVFHLSPEIDSQIGAGWLLIFYILLLLLSIALAAASLVTMLVPLHLPPAVGPVLPLRFLLTAGVAALAFILLLIQLLWGMPLANALASYADKQREAARAAQAAEQNSPITEEQDKRLNMTYGAKLNSLNVHRTRWLTLVVFLHLLAVLAAAAMFWLERRGAKPPPRFDIVA